MKIDIYTDKASVDSVRAQIQETIERAKERIEIWNALLSIVKDLDGKIINKRIESKMKELLPGYYITYDPDYVSYLKALTIYKKNYEDRITIDLCPKKDYFNIAWMIERNLYMVKAGDYKEKMESITNAQLEMYVSEFNSILDKVKSLENELDKEGIQYMFPRAR